MPPPVPAPTASSMAGLRWWRCLATSDRSGSRMACTGAARRGRALARARGIAGRRRNLSRFPSTRCRPTSRRPWSSTRPTGAQPVPMVASSALSAMSGCVQGLVASAAGASWSGRCPSNRHHRRQRRAQDRLRPGLLGAPPSGGRAAETEALAPQHLEAKEARAAHEAEKPGLLWPPCARPRRKGKKVRATAKYTSPRPTSTS